MKRALVMILLLTVAVCASVLSRLNIVPVTFNFYFGTVELSLALLLLSTFCAGTLIGLLLTLGIAHAARSERSQLRRTLKLRDQEIRNLRDIPIKGRH